VSETLELSGRSLTIRALADHDRAALERFAGEVPLHDLLFLDRDIRQPRVLDAWLAATGTGEIDSLVALDGDRIAATTASIRDPLSWSRHVCELRLLVLPEARGIGLGRALLDRCVSRAVEAGAAKLVARMTSDQAGAITLFEETGFRGEALLAAHVRDDAGTPYDLAILALDPQREAARQAAFGE
jgi:GNAT superfamily N-acetyltransferase